MKSNFEGLNKRKELAEQIFNYINRCAGKEVLTNYQKDVVRNMIARMEFN